MTASLIEALDEQAAVEQQRVEHARAAIADATRRLDLITEIRPLAEQLTAEFVPASAASKPSAGAARTTAKPATRRPRSGRSAPAAGARRGSVDDRRLLAAVRELLSGAGGGGGGGVSSKAVADEVGVHRVTAQVHLDGLVGTGVLVRVQEARGRRPAQYGLPGPPAARTPAPASPVAAGLAAAASSGNGAASSPIEAERAVRASAPEAADERRHAEEAAAWAERHQGPANGRDTQARELVDEDDAAPEPPGEEEGLLPPGQCTEHEVAAPDALRRKIELLLLRESPLAPEGVARRLVLNVREVAEKMAELRRAGGLDKRPGGGYVLVDRDAVRERLAQEIGA